MTRPPYDPEDRPHDPHNRTLFSQPSWTNILVFYAMMAAIPVLVWAVTFPITAAIALGTVGVVALAGRRTKDLYECFADCGGFTVDLLGRAEVTIAQPQTCATC